MTTFLAPLNTTITSRVNTVDIGTVPSKTTFFTFFKTSQLGGLGYVRVYYALI